MICADTDAERCRVKTWSVLSTSATYAMVWPSGDHAGIPSYPGSVVSGVNVNRVAG